MKNLFSNATVWWNQPEIAKRDCLISTCYELVRYCWTNLNPAVQFERVETPILTPEKSLQGHVDQQFPMISTGHGVYLRPETTAGSIAAFQSMFPMQNQRSKRMPFCVWQDGKSFREESNPDTMRASKLRLREFWQLEFELFAAANTKADYIGPVATALAENFGGKCIELTDDLPHYSRRTVDWEINGLEIAGCSERTDWPEGIVHEISIGLDRLLAAV